MSERRCTGLHYGTYDYSAACGIAPQHQALDHPVADHAKTVMMVAAAQTGVHVADGGTQVIPHGSPEAVAHGETGWLAEEGDTAGLAKMIGRLLDSPEEWSRMSVAAQARVRRDFDIVKQCEKLEGYYDALA